jgi:DNA processing protein
MMDPQDLDDGLKRWRPRYSIQSTERSIALATRSGIHVLTNWDEQWPEGFDRLGSAAPHALWVRGDVEVLHLQGVAIVGARAATSYGEHVAQELAADLAQHHLIVSGAAYGIDGAAHRAALAVGGKTVAYLAGGSDRPYPAGHANLIERIAAAGAVVSEVPPGSAPTKWRFLARNRLIAAHADAVVVVEAGYRSGSLNTAGHAVSLGVPLGAVPGPVTSAASAGCHRIIQEMDGTLITSAADIEKMMVQP